MAKGTKSPIDANMLAAASGSYSVAGVRYTITGDATEFFGPGQPLPPQAQRQARGRQFDFPVAFNLVQRPRNYEPVSFGQMRNLADGYDLLRLVIETRKDQVEALEWSIKPKAKDVDPDDRCLAVQDFLASPDKEIPWNLWLRKLLEEVFVIDAPAIYPRLTMGGDIYSLDLVDGATIKRVLDLQGRTPIPPQPAYQQILKGLPAVDYTRDELIYMPRNPRVNRVYGYSPVEQIIMTVNIALRRQISQLQYYTEGNIPEALIGVPDDWSPDQIQQFQTYWDSLLEGDTAARRHAKFVPGGMEPTFTRSEGGLKDEMDEWLARIVCFAFSVNPTPFVKQQNRATADNAAEQAWTEGLVPLQKYLKGLLDLVVQKKLGFPDLEFDWTDSEEVDPETRAKIDKIYVDSKVLHPDEVRADLGRDPLTAQQKADMTPPAPVGPDGQPLKPGAPSPGGKPPATDASAKLVKKKDGLNRSTATDALSRRLAGSSARY